MKIKWFLLITVKTQNLDTALAVLTAILNLSQISVLMQEILV